MKVIVVGGGDVGAELAKTLSGKKHDVVVIESEDELCQELADTLNATVIHGNGTKPEVLEEAGIKKADVLVVSTAHDENNLLTCLVAKEMSENLRIITRATKEEYKKIFMKLGIENVVSPETSTVEEIESIITEPDVVDLALKHRGLVELMEMEVKEKSKLAGKPITKIEFPRGSLVAAIKRGRGLIIPEDKERLMAGDRVIIIVRKSMEGRIRNMFK